MIQIKRNSVIIGITQYVITMMINPSSMSLYAFEIFAILSAAPPFILSTIPSFSSSPAKKTLILEIIPFFLGSDSADVSAEAPRDAAVLSAVVIAELTESLYVVSMISEIFPPVRMK
jgi:hypothetical protein